MKARKGGKRPRGRPRTSNVNNNNNNTNINTDSSLKSPQTPAENVSPQTINSEKPAVEEQQSVKTSSEEAATTTGSQASQSEKDSEAPTSKAPSLTGSESKEETKENTIPDEAAKKSPAETASQPTNGDSHPADPENKETKTSPKQPSPETKVKASTTDEIEKEKKESTMTEVSKPLDPAEATANDVPPKPPSVTEETTVNSNHTPLAATTSTSTNYYETTDAEGKVLKIGALRDNKSLDVYAYHRGREGMEPRDAATGELLCDVEPTDTNYKWDEPKTGLQVFVSFPLTDENEKDGPRFEDTIHWNIGDPETPTPEVFAASVAEEYGLSHGQMIELAVSIEQQINRHVRDHCGYADPVAIHDGTGMDRAALPPQTICYPYGGIFQVATARPGTFWTNVGSTAKARKGGKGAPYQGSSSRRRDAASSEDGSRPQQIVYYDDEAVEDIYIDEVEKRMTELSRQDVRNKSDETGEPLGQMTMMQQHVCHICHKRHNLTGKFACGFQSHSYCKAHLSVSKTVEDY